MYSEEAGWIHGPDNYKICTQMHYLISRGVPLNIKLYTEDILLEMRLLVSVMVVVFRVLWLPVELLNGHQY